MALFSWHLYYLGFALKSLMVGVGVRIQESGEMGIIQEVSEKLSLNFSAIIIPKY